MKRLIIVFVALCIAGTTFAQEPEMTTKGINSVKEMKYDFVKKVSPTANGMSTHLYGTPEALEAVIEEQFRNGANAKAKGFKGLQSLEGVIFPDISPLTLDYYYQLDEDKNHPGKTRMTMFISAGNYNFLNSEKYPEEMKAAKMWMVALDKAARMSKMNEQITAQQALVVKSTEALAKVTDEGQKLTKTQTKLKEDIAKLQAELAETEKKIETNKKSKKTTQEAMEVEQLKLKTLQEEKTKLN